MIEGARKMVGRQVLVTGTSSAVGRAVVAQLSAAGEHTHAVDGTPGIDAEQLPWRRHRRHRVPAVGSPYRIPALLRLARAHEIDLVVPTLADELLELAAAANLFAEHGTEVLVSELRGLSMVGDGLYASATLASAKVPVVWSSVPSDLQASDRHRLAGSELVLMVPRTPWSAVEAVSILNPTDFNFSAVGDTHLVCAANPPFWRVSLSVDRGAEGAAVTCQQDGDAITDDHVQSAIDLSRRAARALSLTGPVEVGIAGGGRGHPRVLDVVPGIRPTLTARADLLTEILDGSPRRGLHEVPPPPARGAAPAGLDHG